MGEERGGNKKLREKTNAITSYCNLAKLQLIIILSVYNSYCWMLKCFAFAIALAKPWPKEKQNVYMDTWGREKLPK